MDPSRDQEDKENSQDLSHWINFSESIKNDSEKLSVNSLKNHASISDQLTSQMESFYNSNRTKFLSQAVIDENFEYKHEESFKEIFKFSRKQSAKLDKNLDKGSIPKLNQEFIQNGDDHLVELLNKYNMKNQKVRRSNLGSDSSDDLQLIDEESDEAKLSLNEQLSKRIEKHQEKIKMRSNLMQLMYRKAIQNQTAGQKMAEMNSLEKFNCKKLQRAKTSLGRKKNSFTDTDSIAYSTNIYLTRPKTSFREQIPEKTSFDVSRNLKSQNQAFRLSKNDLNSNIEVFRPAETGEKIDALPKRIKTGKSIKKCQSFMLTCSSPISNSTLLNTSLTKGESPKGLQNYASLNQKSNLVNINIQELIKNAKIMEAKSLSTFWINYQKV